ncbi:hypothetical protein IB252_05390 [Pseudomonas sp. PDM10]|uniref:hypothetical protein n=1 Tax=Pseudomonas sp. PDM10 TaxID=2769269 RepID=UPI0017804312|nr:hypothetical protein [Pseudomonas sp. PDM10]MBD9599271.1 hypothetical protein [Pseudomonas sp. PDM10]
MKRQDLEQKILAELGDRRAGVVNRNAISALFGAFTDPVAALGKIFLGRADAIDAERLKIERGCILDLLCAIDDALVNVGEAAKAQGVVIDGLIETVAFDVEDVVGVDLDSSAGQTRFLSGTHIKTEATGAKRVTGLKIGGSNRPEEH